MMKTFLSLSLSLCLLGTLTACGPSQPVAQTGQSTSNGALAVAEINAKADVFNAMLMTKDANGVSIPLTPERIDSLSIDGKTVAPASIALPGAESAKSVSTEQAIQLQASKVVQQNQPWVIFGANSVYSFVTPKAAAGNKIELKIKGDSQTYQLLRLANVNRGAFVLSKGQVQGAFSLNEGFALKQASGSATVMSSLLAMLSLNASSSLDEFYNPAQFALTSLQNFYQSGVDSVVVYTPGMQQLTFDLSGKSTATSTISADDLNKYRNQTETELGDYISPLTGYIGAWTLEDPAIVALIPGGGMTLELSKTGKQSYKLSATVAGNTYSGEGSYTATGTGGGTGSEPITLEISSGSKKLQVKFRLSTPNTLGATLLKADGVAELAIALNKEISFKRNL